MKEGTGTIVFQELFAPVMEFEFSNSSWYVHCVCVCVCVCVTDQMPINSKTMNNNSITTP